MFERDALKFQERWQEKTRKEREGASTVQTMGRKIRECESPADWTLIRAKTATREGE
jgi:hypothetical protein